MIGFSVSPEDGEANLFGKTVDSLQENVVVGESEITGTLKHVTGYTGFSSNTSEQEGNYLALKVDADSEDAIVAVELVGGTDVYKRQASWDSWDEMGCPKNS